MADYGKYIHETRRSVPTPESLVADGRALFGTFDREFRDMDLLKCRKPAGWLLPEFLKKYRLSLWEATEVHLDNGVLLAAVCDMGLFGMTLNLFYDKRKKKVFSWSAIQPSKKTIIAPNLLNGSVAEARTKNSSVKYVNNFQAGRCSLTGSHADKKNSIEYSFELERVSLPSVVSIPFGPNRPLYSQKDLFKAKGKLVFNGEVFESNDKTTAIVDDHRGYYPYRAHYDWITTMGRSVNGKKKYFGLNLTRNQSTDQERFNENLIWFEGRTSLLPPVSFEHNRKNNIWTVTDEHDMIYVSFDIYGRYHMKMHALLIDIDYHVVFGELNGYVRDADGTKYILDGMMGMGEDKSLRF